MYVFKTFFGKCQSIQIIKRTFIIFIWNILEFFLILSSDRQTNRKFKIVHVYIESKNLSSK